MSILRFLLLIITFNSLMLEGSNNAAAQSKDSSDGNYGTAGVKAMQSFDISQVRRSLIYLASDSLQGRETTEPGQEKAAEFIAGKFKEFGLKPLGDSGTYLQHFPVDVNYISDSSFIQVGGRYFQNNKDFYVLPFGADNANVTAPVVFAGYGYENGTYSDYHGIDANGKIVMLLQGNPSFADSNDIMIRSGLYKRTNASKHGAIAVLIVVNDDELVNTRQRFVAMFGTKTMTLDRGIRENKSAAQIQMAYIRMNVANSLLEIQGMNIEELERRIDSLKVPASIQLSDATIKIELVSEIRQSENVIGMVEGTSLKNEYVVYSAHYDHLGITSDGTIYHGADDNASGTSTVLSIAEAYSKSIIKPKRSIIFLTVSGEEKGLLGSEYFTSHPTVPIKNIVTDLNTDMDGRIDTSYLNRDSNYVFVIGSRRLSDELDSLMIAADSQSVKIKLDYTFDSDSDPNQFYYRSDHYNFARKNIPVFFFFDGNISDYHKPTDTSDKIDFPLLEERAKLIFMTGWNAANLDWRLKPN